LFGVGFGLSGLETTPDVLGLLAGVSFLSDLGVWTCHTSLVVYIKVEFPEVIPIYLFFFY